MFDLIRMVGRGAGLAVREAGKPLRTRTGTFLFRGVLSVCDSGCVGAALESQVTASSKLSKAFTLQPRSLAMDANMLAR